MNKSNKFSPEVRERAVRMVQEHRPDYLNCIHYDILVNFLCLFNTPVTRTF